MKIRQNKGACAWSGRLKEEHQFVYTAFLALNSRTGDRDAFCPPGGRMPSRGRFISCFQGERPGQSQFKKKFFSPAASQVTLVQSNQYAIEAYLRTALRAKCAQSCPTLCNPMNCSPPGSSLSMGFSRQEFCSGLPFPSPGDLPNTGLNSGFLHCRILYRLTYQGTALDLNNTLVKTNELICQANEHYYRQNSIL